MKDIIEVPTQHFGIREHDVISAIIIHDSHGYGARELLAAGAQDVIKLSYHYIIDIDGTTYRCVEDDALAYHAPNGVMNKEYNVNEFSIGIVLAGKREGDIPEEQMDALMGICLRLARDHHISLNRVHGSSTVMETLTVNPINFPWFEFLNTLGSAVLERILTGEEDEQS